MSLLVLMYHRAGAGRNGNSPQMLDGHFAHIAANYRCVLPGERPGSGGLDVCLTFDDASFDFYAVAFPLLRKHGLRALLSVPVSFIRDWVDAPSYVRLAAPADVRRAYSNDDGFCTWPELREMSMSGVVAIAAHGSTHCRLDESPVDWKSEVIAPQKLLSARLGRPVDSFVFPYGRVSEIALMRVKHSYRYAFRIGSADNLNWSGPILYRVAADRMSAPESLFSRRRLAGYRLRRYWNRVRGR